MAEINWSGWTDWANLVSLESASFPENPGTYAVSIGRPIQRLLGIDNNGLLDVGESGNLRERIDKFRGAIGGDRNTAHSAGRRFSMFLNPHFPLSSLKIRWITHATKDEAKLLESQLLTFYLRCHGELPPLNTKFNWKYIRESAPRKA
jgi:hypothetical protein